MIKKYYLTGKEMLLMLRSMPLDGKLFIPGTEVFSCNLLLDMRERNNIELSGLSAAE